MIQLCRQIIEMDNFKYVKELDVCKKMVEISLLDINHDYFDVIPKNILTHNLTIVETAEESYLQIILIYYFKNF